MCRARHAARPHHPYPFEIRRDGERLVSSTLVPWFRTVDLGGPAVDPPLPLTLGFPVGRWEGDTLVIRTVGITDVTVMDAMGLPHSEELVLTERLRVVLTESLKIALRWKTRRHSPGHGKRC